MGLRQDKTVNPGEVHGEEKLLTLEVVDALAARQQMDAVGLVHIALHEVML